MDTKTMFKTVETVLKREGAGYIAVFGSYARKDSHTESDIDVLVAFTEKKSLMDLVRIERELSEQLGINVDIVTENALSPYIRNQVKDEAKVLLQ